MKEINFLDVDWFAGKHCISLHVSTARTSELYGKKKKKKGFAQTVLN